MAVQNELPDVTAILLGIAEALKTPEPWVDDPAFEDAMVEAEVIRADDGFVLRALDGPLAVDAAVEILAQAVGILPRDWQRLDVRVERRGLKRAAVVDVVSRRGSRGSATYARWQVAEAMMPGNPWLEQHAFTLLERSDARLRAERVA